MAVVFFSGILMKWKKLFGGRVGGVVERWKVSVGYIGVLIIFLSIFILWWFLKVFFILVYMKVMFFFMVLYDSFFEVIEFLGFRV